MTIKEQIPGLREAELLEHANRTIAIVAPVVPVLGFSIRVLTPRLQAELAWGRNAFLSGDVPTLRDCVWLLWRLHPDFVAPGCGLRAWSRLLTYYRINLAVYRAGIEKAATEIYEYLAFVHSCSVVRAAKAENAERKRVLTHWAVADACWYMETFGMGLDEYLDTPIPITDQMFRYHLMRTNREHEIMQDSDRIFNCYVTELLNRK